MSRDYGHVEAFDLSIEPEVELRSSYYFDAHLLANCSKVFKTKLDSITG